MLPPHTTLTCNISLPPASIEDKRLLGVTIPADFTAGGFRPSRRALLLLFGEGLPQCMH